MKKIKEFFRKWWLVILLVILLVLLFCAFGSCITASREHDVIGPAGIFGTFIAICYFLNMALKEYFDNKPPKGK